MTPPPNIKLSSKSRFSLLGFLWGCDTQTKHKAHHNHATLMAQSGHIMAEWEMAHYE